jgi:hypothetical protein
MRLVVLMLGLGLTACFSPHYQNGEIRCQAAPNTCPNGYHCAANDTCWLNGHDPLPPPPEHSVHVVFSAGGGIGQAGNGSHEATTSFGQPAGVSTAQGIHSLQLGVLAGTTAH